MTERIYHIAFLGGMIVLAFAVMAFGQGDPTSQPAPTQTTTGGIPIPGWAVALLVPIIQAFLREILGYAAVRKSNTEAKFDMMLLVLSLAIALCMGLLSVLGQPSAVAVP